MAKKRLLFIDDDLFWGEMIVELLTKRDFQVDWFVRAELQGEGAVVLMTPDGTKVPLRPTEYEVALIDGRLKGSLVDGWQLTPIVVALGLPVIALSGLTAFNEQMLAAGAHKAIVKGELFTQLMKGPVSL